MPKVPAILALSLAACVALAEDPQVTDAATKPDIASATAATPAAAAAEKKKDEAFKPPPGFQTRKRGELVLYCKKEATLGTRFKTEKCYDEAQMREYLLALEQQKLDVDRIRGTCGGGDACAPVDPTATH